MKNFRPSLEGSDRVARRASCWDENGIAGGRGPVGRGVSLCEGRSTARAHTFHGLRPLFTEALVFKQAGSVAAIGSRLVERYLFALSETSSLGCQWAIVDCARTRVVKWTQNQCFPKKPAQDTRARSRLEILKFRSNSQSRRPGFDSNDRC